MVQALAENMSNTTPTAEELQGWADDFGLTFPVVADAGWAIEGRYAQDNGIPSFTLLAPGAEVVVTDSFSAESMIEDYLPE